MNCILTNEMLTKRCFKYECFHFPFCEELHVSVATCLFVSHLARWQLFLVWIGDWTGGVTSMLKHGSWDRDRERDIPSADFFLSRKTRYALHLSRLKFMIRKKQTSICYSARRYLPIAQSDRNRDFYMTALCVVPCSNERERSISITFQLVLTLLFVSFFRIPKILFSCIYLRAAAVFQTLKPVLGHILLAILMLEWTNIVKKLA